MSKELENKIKSKKRRSGIIAVVVVFAVLAAVAQLQFDAFDIIKDKITGRETVHVTLEISCKPLSDNMSQLKDQSKAEYIPDDGVILKKQEFKMEKGDTAFDLLKNATKDNAIQAEFTYTQAYDSYFIESIANLYSGDAGGMSGWLYYVNGKSPAYGISGYELQEDDSILFVYSCDGGEDVSL